MRPEFTAPSPIRPTDPRRRVRLHGLDLLRGLAALAWLTWQWPAQLPSLAAAHGEALPLGPRGFEGFLRPLLDSGDWLVGLLFAVSGFVLFRSYSAAIERHRFDAAHFLRVRLARLYPLYAASLLACWALWATLPNPVALNMAGVAGPGQMLAALALVQGWTVDGRIHAANPFALASIGVLVSLTFMLLARARLTGALPLLAAALMAMALEPFNPTLSGALVGFLLGGAAHALHRQSMQWRPRAQARLTGVVLGLSWCGLTLAFAEPQSWLARELLGSLGGFTDGFGQTLLLRLAQWLLVPSLVLSMVRLESYYVDTFRVLAVGGRLASCASLVHLPFLLATASLTSAGGWLASANSLLGLMVYSVMLMYAAALAFRRLQWPLATALMTAGLSSRRRRVA